MLSNNWQGFAWRVTAFLIALLSSQQAWSGCGFVGNPPTVRTELLPVTDRVSTDSELIQVLTIRVEASCEDSSAPLQNEPGARIILPFDGFPLYYGENDLRTADGNFRLQHPGLGRFVAGGIDSFNANYWEFTGFEDIVGRGPIVLSVYYIGPNFTNQQDIAYTFGLLRNQGNYRDETSATRSFSVLGSGAGTTYTVNYINTIRCHTEPANQSFTTIDFGNVQWDELSINSGPQRSTTFSLQCQWSEVASPSPEVLGVLNTTLTFSSAQSVVDNGRHMLNMGNGVAARVTVQPSSSTGQAYDVEFDRTYALEAGNNQLIFTLHKRNDTAIPPSFGPLAAIMVMTITFL